MPRKRKQIRQLLQQTVALRTPALDLSNATANDLLEEVCKMNWLTELNLSHGHISLLPDSIGNLTALTRLDLSENQLTTLPESVSKLTKLVYLNLSHAGYEFTTSTTLADWLKQIPEVVWPIDPAPVLTPQQYIYWGPDHPNKWLEWIRQALKLYSDAFNMEERGIDGTDSRRKADADIQQIFTQVAELEQLLPQFYDDLKNHRFYYSSCESEKMITGNPFRLPTKADEEWLTNVNPSDLLPVQLRDELRNNGYRRFILTLNTATGLQAEVLSCEFGRFIVSHQPYEQDVIYQADCEAQLYQAGPERLCVRATLYGESEIPGIKWFCSENGGHSWQEQASLTYDWLNKNRHSWCELGTLSKR